MKLLVTYGRETFDGSFVVLRQDYGMSRLFAFAAHGKWPVVIDQSCTVEVA